MPAERSPRRADLAFGLAVLAGLLLLTLLRALGLTLLAAVFGVLPWLLYAIAFQRGGEEWTVVAPLALLALVMVVLHWSRVGSRAWTRVESEGARVIG